MKWIHILDRQPAHDEMIVQCDAPYEGHYTMGMRKYDQTCTWEDFMKFRKYYDIPDPDFWWVYAKDFPFPNQENFIA
jgi:hypothetical protein|uniref:Uncharacterized protein n=1 Tax=uncultured Caudovirales phage TaxID=2100421 RepID=A0A6J5KVA2_9CAUD|nr:hypothetical protein UFOVP88_15 [uncultured Caudovirales phage]